MRSSENDVKVDDGQRARADRFAAVLLVCLRHTNCYSSSNGGVDDRTAGSSLTTAASSGPNLLFVHGEPTPAYDAMWGAPERWRPGASPRPIASVTLCA